MFSLLISWCFEWNMAKYSFHWMLLNSSFILDSPHARTRAIISPILFSTTFLERWAFSYIGTIYVWRTIFSMSNFSERLFRSFTKENNTHIVRTRKRMLEERFVSVCRQRLWSSDRQVFFIFHSVISLPVHVISLLKNLIELCGCSQRPNDNTCFVQSPNSAKWKTSCWDRQVIITLIITWFRNCHSSFGLLIINDPFYGIFGLRLFIMNFLILTLLAVQKHQSPS